MFTDCVWDAETQLGAKEVKPTALLLTIWLLAQSGGHPWCWQPNDGDALCTYDSYFECQMSNPGRAGVCRPRHGSGHTLE
jgi:hypothetical protein